MLKQAVFFLFITIALVLSLRASSKEVLEGPIAAQVIDVLDGDTIKVKAKIWLGQNITTNVRIAQIDTPEMRGKCAREKQMAKAAKTLLDKLINKQPVILSNIQLGKYAGRIIADIKTANNVNISQQLIDAGLARRYQRKMRHSWCK